MLFSPARQSAFPLFRYPSDSPPSPSLVAYFDDTRVENLLTAYEREPNGREALGEGLTATYNRIQSTLLNLAVQRGSAMPNPSRLLNSMLPSEPRAALSAAALGLVLAAGAAMAFTRSGRGMLHQAYPSLSTAMFRATAGGRPAVQPLKPDRMDVKAATTLVRSWQEVKYAAMGPNHDTSVLGQVLAEPLLSQFTTKVQKFADQGWFIRCVTGRPQT